MKSKKTILISSLILISIILSACSSAVYASTGWYGLTASTDTTYLAAGGQVYAVDLNTGSQKWKYPADKANAKGFYANPVLTQDGSQILVPSYDNTLYSLDPATRSEKWKFSESKNRLIASPLVTQDMIYQPSSDWNIYALDLNGNKIWAKETGGPIWAQPATKLDCGCIYVASMDHKVYSLDAATGREVWVSQDLGGALVGSPAVSLDGILYIGTFGKEMLALNTTNGSIKWRHTTQDWVWAGPTLANNVLYFGDLSGNFYALNPSDGTELKNIKLNNAVVDSPVISGNNIYLTTESDTLYIIDTTTYNLNSKVIGGVIYSAPVIVGDSILVAPTGFTSQLIALNLDGTQKWLFTPAK
jgi:outer membrane protein assembly factor BamB